MSLVLGLVDLSKIWALTSELELRHVHLLVPRTEFDASSWAPLRELASPTDGLLLLCMYKLVLIAGD